MPATYSPTGAKGLAITKLRRMIALSSTFQARCDLTAAQALERVHLRTAQSDDEMPFAIIGSSPLRWSTLSGGSLNHMRPSGELLLMLQCEPDPRQDNEVDQRHEAEDFFDSVIEDVAALSAADDTGSADGTSHLAINNISPDGPMMEVPEDVAASTGRFYWATWTLEWGYQN